MVLFIQSLFIYQLCLLGLRQVLKLGWTSQFFLLFSFGRGGVPFFFPLPFFPPPLFNPFPFFFFFDFSSRLEHAERSSGVQPAGYPSTAYIAML